MKIYYFCSFHLAKLFRQQPVAVAALLFAAFAAVLSFAVMLYWSARLHEVDGALRGAQQRPPVPMVAAPAPSMNGAVSLPAFSSATFTAQFQSVARDMGMVPEQISYSLEAGPAQPYWRYRINFEVKSGYPQIRKFLAAVSSELPNVALDAIRCRRENTASVGLTCELAMSAFFERANHG